MAATALMKFSSEARPSQYISPFANTEPTCMPLPGHYGHRGSGPSAPDGEIPILSSL